jgi:hypothetical protein
VVQGRPRNKARLVVQQLVLQRNEKPNNATSQTSGKESNEKVVVLSKLERRNTNATATADTTAWAATPPVMPVSLTKTIGKTIL